jgi:hypothetical protein
LFDGASRHFQQYFSYIVAVSFIGGGPEENHRPDDKVVAKILENHDFLGRVMNLFQFQNV